MLAGTSIINAQGLTADATGSLSSKVFGDQLLAGVDAAGNVVDRQEGGFDAITLADGVSLAIGDAVKTVDLDRADPDEFFAYEGARDQLLAGRTDTQQILVGDVGTLGGGVVVDGGDDLLRINAGRGSAAIGDVDEVRSEHGAASVVRGGNDEIAGLGNNESIFVGDVFRVLTGSRIEGGDDTIEGGSGGEAVVGDVNAVGDADATIVGGDDLLSGGGGNDVMVGDVRFANVAARLGAGSDTIDGGAGDDQIFGDVGPNSKIKVVGGGADDLRGGSGDDSVEGQFGNDTVAGGSGDDTVRGGQGNDVVAGDEGNDRLFGDGGRDTLDGGSGNDTLKGGGGDVLNGGDGNDVLIGNGGNDVFVFEPGSGVDKVKGFRDGDVLDLSAFGLDDFGDVRDIARQAGNKVELDFGAGDRLLLQGFDLADLDAGDVIL